jgi:hypothetical protein
MRETLTCWRPFDFKVRQQGAIVNQAGNWFSNWGQVIQTSLTCVSCIFAGTNAWPAIKVNLILSRGAILFYVLVALMVFSVACLIVVLLRNPRHPKVDHAKLDRVNAELSSLNRFELFAVRRLCGVEGMTGEQFYAIVEQLGFPVATKPTQIEIVATFERIATKTPLVLRGAGPSPQWSIQSDARLYVKALAERAPLI